MTRRSSPAPSRRPALLALMVLAAVAVFGCVMAKGADGMAGPRSDATAMPMAAPMTMTMTEAAATARTAPPDGAVAEPHGCDTRPDADPDASAPGGPAPAAHRGDLPRPAVDMLPADTAPPGPGLGPRCRASPARGPDQPPGPGTSTTVLRI